MNRFKNTEIEKPDYKSHFILSEVESSIFEPGKELLVQ